MTTNLSVCGIDCAACEHLMKGACQGCGAHEGKVFWTGLVGLPVCPIYGCVRGEKRFADCGACLELPCAVWKSMKGPSYSDEQHQASIVERVGRLKNRGR